MMDLRVSVAIFFFFLTGGYSLKCYSCISYLMGSCEAKVEICPDGFSKCASITMDHPVLGSLAGSTRLSFTVKGCANPCKPGIEVVPYSGNASIRCCDTDLCNAAAADGVCKASLLLLFCPLLFYCVFQ